MGIKERQDRDRSAVRESILHAARELFVTEGYRTVSMRKIAERIEYSPAAIYGYFGSKDEIFYALAEEGFRMMRESSRDAAVGIVDPLGALRSTFWSYYLFAKDQPQYFELMFVDRSVPEITDPERFTALIEMWQAVHERIERCVAAGVFPASLDVTAAFHILWASLHGAATLHLCQRLGPGESPDLLAADTLDVAIAGLRAGVKTTFVASPCHDIAASAAALTTSGVPDHA
jgi:AcrR family transcriptional regulator